MEEMEIYNIYFRDYDLSREDEYEDAFRDQSSLNEIIVEWCTDIKNSKEFLEVLIPVEMLEYNIFEDLLELLKSHESGEIPGRFQEEVFSAATVNPHVLIQLTQKLEELIEEYYTDDKYCYLIYSKELDDYSSLVRFEYNGISCKYDTGHTTHRKRDERHDFVELYNYDDKELIEWIPCEEGTNLNYGEQGYKVKKILYRDIARMRLKQMRILGELAIKNGCELLKNNEER